MNSTLNKLSAVCAVLVIANAANFSESVIAAKPQLIAQATKSQPHPVFRPIIPQLRRATRIQILLPKYVPGANEAYKLYAIIDNVTPRKYELLLGYAPDCNGGSACRLGTLTAESVIRSTPKLIGRRYVLANGSNAYFVDFKCGANCSDATLTWRRQGVQYTIGLKAGDRASLVRMANSLVKV
jgi:hypothetical protein